MKKIHLSSSIVTAKKGTLRERSAVNQSIDLGILSTLHKKTG